MKVIIVVYIFGGLQTATHNSTIFSMIVPCATIEGGGLGNNGVAEWQHIMFQRLGD